MRVGGMVNDCTQERRNEAGLARSGCADNAEMLSEQFVGEDVGGNLWVLMKQTDGGRRGIRTCVDLL